MFSSYVLLIRQGNAAKCSTLDDRLLYKEVVDAFKAMGFEAEETEVADRLCPLWLDNLPSETDLLFCF